MSCDAVCVIVSCSFVCLSVCLSVCVCARASVRVMRARFIFCVLCSLKIIKITVGQVSDTQNRNTV